MNEDFKKMLLEIDRIWSHVPTSLLEDDQWSSSKAREETAKVIQAYLERDAIAAIRWAINNQDKISFGNHKDLYDQFKNR